MSQSVRGPSYYTPLQGHPNDLAKSGLRLRCLPTVLDRPPLVTSPTTLQQDGETQTSASMKKDPPEDAAASSTAGPTPRRRRTERQFFTSTTVVEATLEPGQEQASVETAQVVLEKPSDIWNGGWTLMEDTEGLTLGEEDYKPLIEVAICLTIGSTEAEDDRVANLKRSLEGIAQNLEYLSGLKGEPSQSTWLGCLGCGWKRRPHQIEEDPYKPSLRARQAKTSWSQSTPWKRACLVIIVDGKDQVTPGLRDYLKEIGLAIDVLEETEVSPSNAHLVEGTIVLPAASSESLGNTAPIQSILIAESQESGQVTSHSYFFSVCSLLQPRTVLLLDNGVQMKKDALWRLWLKLYARPQVVGCLGRVELEKDRHFWLWHPLRAGYRFSRKMAHHIELPFSSLCGLVSDDHSTFACYRYGALLSGAEGSPRPICFLIDQQDGNEGVGGSASPRGRSLLDRYGSKAASARSILLSTSLVFQPSGANVLAYEHRALATMPAPSMDTMLTHQADATRARLHLALHQLTSLPQLWSHKHHSYLRILLLHIQALIHQIRLFLDFTHPSNVIIGLTFVAQAFLSQMKTILLAQDKAKTTRYDVVYFSVQIAKWIFLFSCLCLLTLCIRRDNMAWTGSTMVSNRGSKRYPNRAGHTLTAFFGGLSWLFAFFIILAVGSAIYLFVEGILEIKQGGGVSWSNLFYHCTSTKVMIILLVNYGVIVIASLLALDPGQAVTSIVTWIIGLAGRLQIHPFHAYATAFHPDFYPRTPRIKVQPRQKRRCWFRKKVSTVQPEDEAQSHEVDPAPPLSDPPNVGSLFPLFFLFTWLLANMTLIWILLSYLNHPADSSHSPFKDPSLIPCNNATTPTTSVCDGRKGSGYVVFVLLTSTAQAVFKVMLVILYYVEAAASPHA